MGFEGETIILNLRHTYAPKNERTSGGVCLPPGPAMIAARLKGGGADVELQDANLRPLSIPEKLRLIAVGVLGPVYVDPAMKLYKKLRKELGPDVAIAFGCPGVSGFTDQQFQQLFPGALYGNNDVILAKAAGADVRAMPSRFEVSLIEILKQKSDEDFVKYMNANPVPYPLSDGCKFKCEFCIAKHTIVDPITAEEHKVHEQYRSPTVVETDFRYIVERAKQRGVPELNIYLSNLDLFQTPKKLMEFAEIVFKIKKDNPEVSVKMRGLSTAASFMQTHRHMPQCIERIVEAGLDAVGFGVDGGDAKTWKKVGKKQNTIQNCMDAIRTTRNIYGIRPQILEVIGVPQETQESLDATVQFGSKMVAETDAEMRPYLLKWGLPGTPTWGMLENQPYVQSMLAHPKRWADTDFSAWRSERDPEQRELVNETYAQLLNLPNNTTVPVWVPSRKLTKAEIQELTKRFPGRTPTDHLTAEECGELNVGNYDT